MFLLRKNIVSKDPTQYWFSSRNIPLLTEWIKVWYKNVNGSRVKVLPCNDFLAQYVTPVALAHMIMGDGYWDDTILVCTDCFTRDELLRLIDLR